MQWLPGGQVSSHAWLVMNLNKLRELMMDQKGWRAAVMESQSQTRLSD